MCVIKFAVKNHMVNHQVSHNGECTVPVVWPVQRSLKGGTC